MADETSNKGSRDDVKIITPPSGRPDFNSTSQDIVQGYQATLLSQKIQKQHREVLASMADFATPNSVGQLSITAGVGYDQTKFQQVIDQVNALTVIVGQLSTIVNFLKQKASENIVTPS